MGHRAQGVRSLGWGSGASCLVLTGRGWGLTHLPGTSREGVWGSVVGPRLPGSALPVSTSGPRNLTVRLSWDPWDHPNSQERPAGLTPTRRQWRGLSHRPWGDWTGLWARSPRIGPCAHPSAPALCPLVPASPDPKGQQPHEGRRAHRSALTFHLGGGHYPVPRTLGERCRQGQGAPWVAKSSAWPLLREEDEEELPPPGTPPWSWEEAGRALPGPQFLRMVS